jgi:hypothetical protein
MRSRARTYHTRIGSRVDILSRADCALTVSGFSLQQSSRSLPGDGNAFTSAAVKGAASQSLLARRCARPSYVHLWTCTWTLADLSCRHLSPRFVLLEPGQRTSVPLRRPPCLFLSGVVDDETPRPESPESPDLCALPTFLLLVLHILTLTCVTVRRARRGNRHRRHQLLRGRFDRTPLMNTLR